MNSLCPSGSRRSPFIVRRDVRRLAAGHRQRADYESTMGLVQKIFYYHMPSAWMFLIGGDRVRRGERALSVDGRSASRSHGAGGGGADRAVRPAHARHRSAVGAQGVGHVVDLGRPVTSSLVGWMIACAYLILRRYGGPGSEKLAAGAGAVRHGQRAVHLHLGELLAHDSPGDAASCRRCRSRWGSRCGSVS